MNKSIVLLLAILAALLVIYLLVSEGEKRELTPEVIDNFLAIDSGAVNKVRVSKLGSEMNFEKRTDGWQMLEGEKTYKAEPSAVAEIEKLAYSLRVGEIVSSNPDKQMLFQVDTLMGTKVEFYRDDHFLGDIIIGKMGSNYQNCYVRKPGSEEVYNAVGPYSYLFNRPPSSFKDKTLLAFDRSLVNAIEFSGLGTDYTLLHQDTLWKVVPHQGESFVGDQSKIERVVDQLANLRFSDFVENPDSLKLDFSEPDLELIIGLKDGSDRRLKFVAEGGDSKNYYVKSSQAPEPYLIYDYIVNNLAKKRDDLRLTGKS